MKTIISGYLPQYSGLGNCLCEWELLYFISKKENAKLLVPHFDILDHISLPNTEIFKEEDFNQVFNGDLICIELNTEDYFLIDGKNIITSRFEFSRKLMDIFNIDTRLFDEDGFYSLESSNENVFSKIEFSKDIKNYCEKFLDKDYVSVHIRKGDYLTINNCSNHRNDDYFISEILKYNLKYPNTCFFISIGGHNGPIDKNILNILDIHNIIYFTIDYNESENFIKAADLYIYII